MSDRPPRDVKWLPDNVTGISVPSPTKQNAGWIVEKVPLEFLNWLWNRCTRWFHYFSGQSQEFIVIDSTNADEKDYDTLAAYIADAPTAGDKILMKETQALTAQMIIPSGITLRLLDGVTFTRSTVEVNSVIKFGADIIIEGDLNLVLSQTGTIAKAIEFDGDNVVGKINVENASTGILTTAYHINAAKSANNVNGVAQNSGSGALTNVVVDDAAEDTNLLTIYDEPNDQIIRSLGSNTFFSGVKFKLGSDADGDIYYRDTGILKRLPKGTDGQILQLVAGLPVWFNQSNTESDTEGLVQTGTTVIPDDNTVPSSTEGDQYLTTTITPSRTGAVIGIHAILFASHSASGKLIATLVKDSDPFSSNTVAVTVTAGEVKQLIIFDEIVAPNTSPITINIRAGGSNAGTFTLNGQASASKFGVSTQSGLYLTEI